MRNFWMAGLLVSLLQCIGCTVVSEVKYTTRTSDRAMAKLAVATMLTEFNHAAATADFEKYFDLFHERGVFLGTDGSERWGVKSFKEFAKPHFKGEAAWIFVPEVQNISLSVDAQHAWFDEELKSKNYGDCRGTGMATWTPQGWKICQYSLSVPIPNELLLNFVEQIRGQKPSVVAERTTTILIVRHAEKQRGAGRDPHLTEDGLRRAERLALSLQDLPISTVFATQYLRTQETAAPLAAALGLKTVLVDAGDTQALAKLLWQQHQGKTVLCVGHSNTVPQLIKDLGVKEEVRLTEKDYGQLFIIRMGATSQLQRLNLPL